MDWFGSAMGRISCARRAPAVSKESRARDADHKVKRTVFLNLLIAVTPSPDWRHSSGAYLLGGGLFLIDTELVTKGGQHLVSEVVLATRAEASIQRGTEDGGRNRLVEGRRDRPAPLPRVRHPAGELRQVRAIEERHGGQVQEPRGDDTATAPDLGDIGQIQVVRVILRV